MTTVCQFFVIVLKIICSLIRIQALFNNYTNFYRGLEAFYIALKVRRLSALKREQ